MGVVCGDIIAQRRILGSGEAVGDAVIYRSDRHIDRRGLGDPARGHGIGVAVGAIEVGVRRVGHRAVGLDGHRAVGALGHGGDRGTGIGKAVIGQHIGIDRGVLGRARAVIDNVGNRGYRTKADCSRVSIYRSVTRGIGQVGYRAIVVRSGVEGHIAVHGNRDCADRVST